jgi:putative oxidoreductase
MNNKITLSTRTLLGLIFFVFGLNGFLNFIPMPPHPEAANNFLGALAATGYFFPVLKATEVITGFLLLTGFFAPLALVILAPIVLQIFLFHFFLTPTPSEWVLPIVIVILEGVTAAGYWDRYKAILQAK